MGRVGDGEGWTVRLRHKRVPAPTDKAETRARLKVGGGGAARVAGALALVV
jgi:hypothetical protein